MAAILFVALALAALYWFPMRRWFGRGFVIMATSPLIAARLRGVWNYE